MLTKAQSSELRLHFERLIATEKALLEAEQARSDAKHKIDTFLWNLENADGPSPGIAA
jgi:hypothetical protein